ncbi:hypothetical protein DYE49_03795 [Treponema rectale]|uniref:RNase III domain-containing protein n=1 Tax=Treponema rectale TaxID=744512 RepID=A0A7M1XJL9_9SPIR|nr:hypothetical protein DYE49_03795 [Treponema rectale]
MDLFEEYLSKHEESEWVKRALTDRSYKKESQEKKGKTLPKDETNEDLATYGDAVIKLGYLDIMLDKEEQLSEAKKKYESDEFFVTVIAKHYRLLDHILTDSSDEMIVRDYDYEPKDNPEGKADPEEKNDSKEKKEPKKSNARNPHKYIATAVEAMIGAIYIEEGKKLKPIIELLREWIK